MLKQITEIYSNDKLDAAKKVMLFTSKVCIPEILKQEDEEKKKTDDITKVEDVADDLQ